MDDRVYYHSRAPKYVIICTGNISSTYADVLQAVVGCENLQDLRRQPSHGLAGHPSLTCWPTLVDVDKPFDVVIVATTNGPHPYSAIKAAGLGKHIWPKSCWPLRRPWIT
ncbi:MAG: hypothetical protein GPOALKHO_000813 [Sodalis sp.]|uniref:hypothetical protein n=1 Tax=Sodalis sp. (in: enterobacteria) TaxID=1898979 RepID=UPI003872D2D9|nr:MAG: hypothetical protein GPOALKHO_000813 [Sodalis sp.]